MKGAADTIEQVALALRVTRPLETMEAAAQLDRVLRQAREAVAARAQPFALLTEQVRDAYAPFALADPLDPARRLANLRLQLAMIHWYLDKDQVVQAATLAREWLVSVVAYRLEVPSLVSRDERMPVEYALSNASRLHAGKRVTRPSPHDAALVALPASDDLVQVWDKISQVRNDIAHVGMNEHPSKAEALRRKLAEIAPLLENLARSLEIEDKEAGR